MIGAFLLHHLDALQCPAKLTSALLDRAYLEEFVLQ